MCWLATKPLKQREQRARGPMSIRVVRSNLGGVLASGFGVDPDTGRVRPALGR